MKNKSNTLRWYIWALAALFYFYGFVLRISPSVMIFELMRSFNITAASVGLLSVFYFYIYTPIQLPVGMLMDHFGVKKVLSLASLVCGTGAIVYALSYRFSLAAIGRILIGGGSSFAFVAMIYIESHWFKKHKRAFLIGIANSIAMLGAFAGSGPLATSIVNFGWRQTFVMLGIFGIIIGLCVFLLLRLDPKDKKIEKETAKKESHIKKNLKFIIKQKNLWINALVTLLFYITTAGFGGLWGLSFIQISYSVDKQTAGYAISMMFLGWVIGGPLTGFFSDFFKKRTIVIKICIILTLISLIPVIYFPFISIHAVYILLFLVGFFSSAELLNFSLAIELTAAETKATVVAFTNLICTLGDTFVQPFVGFLLDLHWQGKFFNGLRIYETKTYQLALTSFPVCLFFAFLLMFFIKEKKYQKFEKLI